MHLQPAYLAAFGQQCKMASCWPLVLCFHSPFAAGFCTTRVNISPASPRCGLHLSCAKCSHPMEVLHFAPSLSRQCNNTRPIHSFIHSSIHSVPYSTMKCLSGVNSLLHQRVFKPFDATNLLLFYILLLFFLPTANTTEQTRYTSMTATSPQTIYIVRD